MKQKLKVEFLVLFDVDWLNGFFFEEANYLWVDEGDSKGHNEGLGFEFEYTVKDRIVRGLSDRWRSVDCISTKE